MAFDDLPLENEALSDQVLGECPVRYKGRAVNPPRIFQPGVMSTLARHNVERMPVFGRLRSVGKVTTMLVHNGDLLSGSYLILFKECSDWML
jgi:hypothetical protein